MATRDGYCVLGSSAHQCATFRAYALRAVRFVGALVISTALTAAFPPGRANAEALSCRDDRPITPAPGERRLPVFSNLALVHEITVQGNRVVFSGPPPAFLSARLSDPRFLQDLGSLDPDNIDPERSLLITDLGVVEDPARTYDPVTGRGTPLGKWTFAFLMKQLAEAAPQRIDPVVFIREWLRSWERDDPINGWPGETLIVPAIGQYPDEAHPIVNAWRELSGGRSLDLGKVPFRLLAIVNRIDLRGDHVQAPAATDAGELRFVFGAVKKEGTYQTRGTTFDFLVILEYRVDYAPGVRAWADKWCRLGRLRPGSDEFRSVLTRMTDHVSIGDPASGRPPALNDIRTNENVLVGPRRQSITWQLREFRRDASGKLRQSPVSRTPGSVNLSLRLKRYLDEHGPGIGSPDYEVPLSQNGLPFRADVAESRWHGYWNFPGIDPSLLNRFAIQTCDGCHHMETRVPERALGPASFAHVLPREPGTRSEVSSFLSSQQTVVRDPRYPLARSSTFHEVRRRQCYLDSAVKGLDTASTCSTSAGASP